MGERSQREAGRCAIISVLVTCSGMTPSPVDTLCASQSNGLSLSQQPHFCHTDRLYRPLHTRAHTQTHTHTLTHTHNITHPHTLLTQSTNTHSLHTLTHTFYSHTHTPSHTHTLTHSSHTHRHIPHALTNTHPHILLTFTHTHIQSLQEHRHRKHGDPAGMLTHQAHGVCGNSPESHLRSVAGTSTHWEPLGLLELPENKGDSGGTQADPGRSRPNLTAL